MHVSSKWVLCRAGKHPLRLARGSGYGALAQFEPLLYLLGITVEATKGRGGYLAALWRTGYLEASSSFQELAC